MYCEDELLPLSGIQHFAFCRRQWAIIHIEQSWEENVHTVLGDLFHARAHDACLREKRGDTLTIRGLNIRSLTLGVSGQCDVVEFHLCEDGIPLNGEAGLWRVVPVEYKKGRRKLGEADELQLCAQAICLEEMLCTDIPKGYLYHGQTRTRDEIPLTTELRKRTHEIAASMHELFRKGHTPSVRRTSRCAQCSLQNLCLPEMDQKESVTAYYARRLKEES